MNQAEALLHGDLHTGSVMVTETDTRVIDPEFAFYGPMGFDLGVLIGNFLLACVAQTGAGEGDERDDHRIWLARQIPVLWESFLAEFSTLWHSSRAGNIFAARLNVEGDVGCRIGWLRFGRTRWDLRPQR